MMKDLFDGQEELSMSYEEAREKKEALEKMLESEGWTFVREFLRVRISGLKNQLVFMKVQTQEDVAQYNALQGRCLEADLLPQALEGVLTDLKLQVKKYQDQQEAQTQENANVQA